MSATVSAIISSNLMKKVMIPFFCTPNFASTLRASSRTSPPGVSFLPAASIKKTSNFISLAAQLLLVHNQSNPPPEFPPTTPRGDDDLSYPVPPEVPQLPRIPEIETNPPDEIHINPPGIPDLPGPGPDFPVPPTPSPHPDIPLPPPDTPPSPPPEHLPPRSPPDPDILPPPTVPPPDIQPPPDTPPDIKPPTGPFVF
ncbi:hypothetical protein Tsubulata_036021 [Turnera subulata]|uniref:Uncharacterized protein n=1 Tax=Turnera subulata TaxID=218843 RepID=A0A9Q0GJ35_9ROSI|nr:hypothetical protein Tsubulata_036021 [Turnera subulata]